MRRLLSFTVPLLILAGPLRADPPEQKEQQLLDYVRANYTKFEYNIPMRDGITLFTQVFVPKDTSRTYPFLMTRTPYTVAPYGEDLYPEHWGASYEKFIHAGYILVRQDVRGRYLSQGVFREMTPLKTSPKGTDESTDCYDTVEWLIKNIPGNNGKLGIFGISYPGYYTIASVLEAHPAIAAASPQAPMMDLFKGDDAYHNGAFMLAANFGFYVFFKQRGPEPEKPREGEERFVFGTPDSYDFYLRMGPLVNANEKHLKSTNPLWKDQVDHWKYDDYWKQRAVQLQIQDIRPALLTVGGWFDAEDLQGPLRLFRTVREKSPQTDNHIVMGPWVHGGWARGDGDHLGDIGFNAKTSEFFRDEIQFPFFEHILNGKDEPKFPVAWMFETGTNRWRKFDSWPPAQVQPRSFYLTPGGKLTTEIAKKDTYSEYVSDPTKPVPFIGRVDSGVPQDYMDADQRFASSRTDVLVFQTEPLDHDVIVAGPIGVKLRVLTTGTDSDFDVKLIDVYPDDYPDPNPNPKGVHMGGYQQLVRGEPMRGKFRQGFEKPVPFQPGVPDAVSFTMPDILHSFRRGHRIMVHVQSSWFPLTDRNPQKFGDIPNMHASDFQKATQRVYADSTIELNILP
jgi:hypothetical protein